MRLLDKAILVTGSTTGIGRAIALAAVREGARVLLHGRNREAGEALLREHPAKLAFFAGDLADPEVPAQLVRAALAAFGRLDAVVNNAAWVPTGTITDTGIELWDTVQAVNLRAPFQIIQVAVPELSRTNGCVLNIGSINAYAGEPELLAYSVSKGGLTTLTRNLGDSLHRDFGIRVNQINPGWTLTDSEIRKQREHGLPVDWPTRVPREFAPSGSILPPESVAACALYFLSDESRPVSAAVVDLEQYPVIGRNPPKRF